MDNREKQDRLLRDMMEDFAEGDMPAELFLKEETGGVTDILRVALDEFGRAGDDALAEFFFMELDNGAPDVVYFASVITLADSMEQEHLPELYKAIAKLNFYLPAGCFAVSSNETTLAFKVMALIPAELSEEGLLRQMNISAAHALELAEPYAALLMGIAEGTNELADVEMLLP